MSISEAGRKAFEEWWSKQKDLQQPPPDESGIAFIVWQASRTSLLADIQSPECVDLLDPNMPNQELRLHMGELTADECLVARAAIQWANSRVLAANVKWKDYGMTHIATSEPVAHDMCKIHLRYSTYPFCPDCRYKNERATPDQVKVSLEECTNAAAALWTNWETYTKRTPTPRELTKAVLNAARIAYD